MNAPEPGRSNHIYSAYKPCVGDPVTVRYDNWNEIFVVTGDRERIHWPPNGTEGVVIGFRKSVSGIAITAITVLLGTGRLIELADSSLDLDVTRTEVPERR